MPIPSISNQTYVGMHIEDNREQHLVRRWPSTQPALYVFLSLVLFFFTRDNR